MNKLTSAQWICRAKQIHKNSDSTSKYDYSKTNYIDSRTKLKIICPIHGEFETYPHTHLNSEFGGCKKCANKNLIKHPTHPTLSNEEFIKRAQEIHKNSDGTPKYDYSKTNYISMYYKIKFVCPIHGEKEQFPTVHLKGYGCQECAELNRIKNLSLSNEEFIKRAQEIHKNSDGTPKYDYSKTNYINHLIPVTIKCIKHNIEYQILPQSHLKGFSGCSKCSNYSISNKEKEVFNYIKSIYSKIIESSNRNIIYPQELDIYIPEKNLAIEFDGLYWHNENYKSKDYHMQKTKACEEKGIQLIHVFEDEWIEKRSIVESRIKQLLGLNDQIIYARKCIIKTISSEQERVFFNNNHLQCYVASSICYGLFFSVNNKEYLVAAMSFGNLRKNLGMKQENSVYEMYRFACLKNFRVVGGASKLFKHFIKRFNPKQVISFADRRWSINSEHNLYRQLGFVFSGYTDINYFYVEGTKRINRFSLRKDILVSKYGCSEDISEHEFCNSIGLFRIYDVGSIKYIWYNNNKN